MKKSIDLRVVVSVIVVVVVVGVSVVSVVEYTNINLLMVKWPPF